MKNINNLFDLHSVHPQWRPIIEQSLYFMDKNYLQQLKEKTWLPDKNHIFNAFSLPVDSTRYILFGESPYPRVASANGYAFWDGATHEIWSPTGLAKPINRATSLRNFIKMLLVTHQHLQSDVSQPAIQALDKTHFVKTIPDLFANLLDAGFLLLNTSLVLSDMPVKKEARYWQPFMDHLLEQLYHKAPHVQLVLLGKVAEILAKVPSAARFAQFSAEHPYNLSFINNPRVQNFFRRFELLYSS